jgi:hypothetical protein
MGKGSAPRPFEIPKDQFRDNWDAIFGKKDKKDDKPKDDLPVKDK